MDWLEVRASSNTFVMEGLLLTRSLLSDLVSGIIIEHTKHIFGSLDILLNLSHLVLKSLHALLFVVLDRFR